MTGEKKKNREMRNVMMMNARQTMIDIQE